MIRVYNRGIRKLIYMFRMGRNLWTATNFVQAARGAWSRGGLALTPKVASIAAARLPEGSTATAESSEARPEAHAKQPNRSTPSAPTGTPLKLYSGSQSYIHVRVHQSVRVVKYSSILTQPLTF